MQAGPCAAPAGASRPAAPPPPCELLLRRGDRQQSAVLALAGVAELEGLAPQLDRLLHPNELGVLQGLRFARRRSSFLLGRIAAKRAIGCALGTGELARIDIGAGVFGQPVVLLAEARRPDVSISHALGLGAAVAFPPGHPLAIDIEAFRPDAPRIMRSFVAAAEAKLLDATPWREAVRMTLQWSAKEALSKVMRFGLTVPPAVLAISRIEPQGPHGAVLRFENFLQYRCIAWLAERGVLSLVLPAATELQGDVARLIQGVDWGREPEGPHGGTAGQG